MYLYIQQTAQQPPPILCWAMEMDREDSDPASASFGEVRGFHTNNCGLGVSRLGSEPQLHP